MSRRCHKREHRVERVAHAPPIVPVTIARNLSRGAAVRLKDSEVCVKANARLLDLEREQLMTDLKDIPRTAVGRKVNEFVRRVRCAKIHCLIMSELKDKMPSLVGQRAKQDKLVVRLEETFLKVQQTHSLAVGDFPPIEPFREALRSCKLESYTKLTKEKLEKLDRVLEVEVPALMRRFGNPFDGK